MKVGLSQELENLISIVEVIELIEAQQFFTYYTVNDERVCDACDRYNQGSMTRTEIISTFPYLIKYTPTMWVPLVHPNCLLKGTLITTNKGLVPIEKVKVGMNVLTHKGRFRPVIQTHKNGYDGVIYQIGESWLTGNHPVLTIDGWVKSENLKNSDCVISVNLNSSDSSTITKPENIPSSLFKKNILSIIYGSLPSIFMPFSTVNLNSNFCAWDSKVNIENANRVLRNNFNVVCISNLKKLLFCLVKFTSFLNADSSFNKSIIRLFGTSNFVMACFSLIHPLLWCHMSPFKRFSFALSSSWDSSFNQSAGNSSSRNVKSVSNVFFGASFVKVKSDDFVSGKFNSFKLHTPTPLNNIYNAEFKGDVYNLSVAEDESYCIGKQRIVVHNCRCVLLFEESDETPRPKELTTDQLIDTVKDEILSKKQDVLADVNLSKEDKFKIIRREIEVKIHGGKTTGSGYVDDLGDIDPDDDDLWDLVALGILDTLYRRKKREESKL